MKHALALSAILAIFVFFARREVFSWPYYYDEADYMFAASLGVSANWTDRPAQSLAEFVRVGLRDGRDPTKRTALSAASRAGSDVNFYRHWHGPLYFYWLAAVARFNPSEQMTRSLGYVFPTLTALVMYFGCLWIFGAREAAMLGSAFYLWSYATVFSNELAPHQLFVLCSIAALVLLIQWRATGDARLWYGSVVAAACAFCTLEVALVLVLVLVACAGRIPSIAKSALLFVLTIGALWPGALTRLTFIKGYLFMAYLAVFRTSAWGGSGFLETWRMRFSQSPGEWMLIAIAAVLYFRLDSASRRTLAPLVLFGGLMMLALLRVNTDTPRYMLPFLPALQFAAGCTFGLMLKSWKPRVRWGAVAALLVIVFSDTLAQIRSHPVLPAPRLAEVLAIVRSARLEGEKVLVPQTDLPMIHYYVPRVNLTGYVDERERSALLAGEDCRAVLNPGHPVILWRRSSDSPHYPSQR